MRCASAEELMPIAVRISRKSTLPICSPTSRTMPVLGNICALATRISVVLPAPLGPMMIQRSSSSTCQLRGERIAFPSRTTDTPRMSIMMSSSTAASFAGLEIRGDVDGVRSTVMPLMVPETSANRNYNHRIDTQKLTQPKLQPPNRHPQTHPAETTTTD